MSDNNFFGFGSLEALKKAVADKIMHPIVLEKHMQSAEGRKEQAKQSLRVFYGD